MELRAKLSRRPALPLHLAVGPLLLLGFIAATHAHAQEQGPKGSSLSVGVAVRAFLDDERSNWQGTGPRPLTTIIWYPAASALVHEEVEQLALLFFQSILAAK